MEPEEEPDEAEEREIKFIVKRPTQEEVNSDHTPGAVRSFMRWIKDHLTVPSAKDVPINITRPEINDILPDHEVERIMENYDPRLDLSRYKFPPVSILKDHKSENSFDNTEVFENKENIIKTLRDHKISISQISATVGPTVTSV